MQARVQATEGYKITSLVRTAQSPRCLHDVVVELGNRQQFVSRTQGKNGWELEMETWEPPVSALEFKYSCVILEEDKLNGKKKKAKSRPSDHSGIKRPWKEGDPEKHTKNNPATEVGDKQERVVSWPPEEWGREKFLEGNIQQCQSLPRPAWKQLKNAHYMHIIKRYICF